MLRLFGAQIGESVRIFPSCHVFFPWNLRIGTNVDIAWDVKLYNLGMLTIGNQVVISQQAHLCGGTHDYLDRGFELRKCDITIGSNVWIAADAFVGPGVSVGENVVIAARSVLVHSAESGSVYAGNPARKIKSLEGRVREGHCGAK